MNINGFQVEEHGSGYAVTIRLNVGSEENLGRCIKEFKNIAVQVLAAQGTSSPDEAETPELSTPHEAQKAEVVASGRRRRGVSSREPEKKGADPTSAAAAVGAAGRRGRRASTASEAPAKSPSKLSDEDLTKAASAAARRVSVVRVSAVLEEFGVSKVNELKGDAREEFLARVDELSE